MCKREAERPLRPPPREGLHAKGKWLAREGSRRTRSVAMSLAVKGKQPSREVHGAERNPNALTMPARKDASRRGRHGERRTKATRAA